MPTGIVKKTLFIDNMTCVNCESRIERELGKLTGVLEVSASYVSGTAAVTYDETKITLNQIEALLRGIDYHVKQDTQQPTITGQHQEDFSDGETHKKKESRDYSGITGAAIIIFVIYIISRRFGLLNIFNSFPVATENMGYGMLLVIGLLTSVHCVAMCGGICLSQSLPKEGASGISGNRLSALKPSLLYNIGRVISYTIIGGIVGAIGSVVSFSGTMRGIVQILAGAFTVIMGINMLGIFPWLRRLNPRMPKFIARKINAQKSGKGPFIIGLLNGLMPCGPLQAMQLYALSTGSPLKGAISMLLFSVGTVPLLFAFGAVSTFLNKKFTGKMMTVSAALVVVLGVFMFNNGINLSGLALPTVTTQAGTVKTAATATMKDGVQVVTTGLASGKYEPIVVKKGIPVKWTIQAGVGDINGCNNRIIIQKYGIEKTLQTGDNIIEFTPTESGTVPFSCWMGMIRSKILVVDDLGNIDQNDIKDDVPQSSGGGCCGGGGTTASGDSSGLGGNISFDYSLLKGKTIPNDKLAVGEIKDGIQYVNITYDKNGFSPAVVVVQKDLKTTWIINGGNDKGNDTLLFPNYQAQLQIVNGENPINFIPSQDFDYFTSDGSYLGYVKVVDDISKIDKSVIQKEVADFNPIPEGR